MWKRSYIGSGRSRTPTTVVMPFGGDRAMVTVDSGARALSADVLAHAPRAVSDFAEMSEADDVGFFFLQLVSSGSRLRPVRAAMGQGADQVPVESRDGLQGNLFRADSSAFTDVGAAAESLCIMLSHHANHSGVALRLTLR